jgi:aubergine-like protein
MPGYSTNVMITESGIFVRVGIKNKFINSKTCLDKIRDLQDHYRNGEYMRKVTEFFKNYSVMTVYGNHKVYKIDAVTFDLNVLNKTINYKDKNGVCTEITLQKYYKDQYQRDIKNSDQPLLITYVKNSKGENDPIYLVPELCYLTGMDDEMRSMESLKKSMTNRTKVGPKDRMDRINEIKSMIYNKNTRKRIRINKNTGEERQLPDPDDIRQQWGVNIGDFKQFTGRELNAPEIEFEGDIGQIRGGKFRPSRLKDPVHLEASSWTIICTQYNREAADKLINNFKNASRQMGVNVETPSRVKEHRGRNSNEWIDELKNMDFNHGLRIILVVLDRSTKSFYSSIKRFLYAEVGIPTQVVLKENCSKNLSYFSNVLNQMIVKMGGILYKIALHSALSSKVY